MKQLRPPVVPSFVPAVFFLGLPRGIHFYIDPGTGSIVVQAVIGAFAALLVSLGMFWKQIRAFLCRPFYKFKPHETSTFDPA